MLRREEGPRGEEKGGRKKVRGDTSVHHYIIEVG